MLLTWRFREKRFSSFNIANWSLTYLLSPIFNFVTVFLLWFLFSRLKKYCVTLKGLRWAELSKAFIKQKLGYVIHKACIFKDVNKYETEIKKTVF